MNLLEGVRIALSNLRTNKLRTFLTLLGNIIGTLAVIAVFSMIYGADRYMRDVVLDEGTDVFTVMRVNQFAFLSDFDEFMESLNNPNLTLEDRDYLAGKLDLARVVGASISASADLRAGKYSYRGVGVRGKTEDYSLLEDLPLAVGRHLNRQDVLASRQTAVLGWDIAQELFPRVDDPTGREFRLGARHFKVAGVVADRGTTMGNSRNQFVIVPLTAFQKVYGTGRSIEIKIAAADLEAMDDAQDEATFWLRIRHRLRPTERTDFAIMTSQQLLNIWAGISSAVYAIVVPLGGLSMVIGGIVLMNVMLVSVTERTREVGIRKALGASRQSIMWQFLIESIILSVTGGIIGITSGLLLALVAALLTPLTFAVSGVAIAAGLGVTFVFGIFFGTFPAWKAAGLAPVEALRFE